MMLSRAVAPVAEMRFEEPIKGGLLTPASKRGGVKGSTALQVREFVEDVRGVSLDITETPVTMPDVNDLNDSEFSSVRETAIRYELKDLLDLREQATQYADGHFNFAEIYQDEPTTDIRFTTDPKQSKTAISHHCDLEVELRQIVQVYNLSDEVTWPLLNTFCSKTIGIAPLSVRMMRRERPAQAMLIFHSAEEAKSFLSSLPSGVRLKGRRPRFEICTGTKPVGARDDKKDENVPTAAIVFDRAESDTSKANPLKSQNPNVETANTEDGTGWSNVSRGKKQNQKTAWRKVQSCE